MAGSDSLATITQYVVDQLTSTGSLGLQEVHFGDQDLIQAVPAACVEPISVERELIEARRFVNCTISLDILVYEGNLENRGLTLKQALQKGEAVMDVLDALDTLGGNALFSWCTDLEVGQLQKGNAILAASKIGFRAISQVQLAS